MTSKILGSMFRNVEFWGKWNVILSPWGVLFQIHLFIQNLVASKYLKFSVSDCESLARLYTRQMGVGTRHNTVFFIRHFGEIWVSLPQGLAEG